MTEAWGIEPLDTVPDAVLEQAAPAMEGLRALLPHGPFPVGLDAASLTALLAVMDGVARAAAEARIDLTPADAAGQLRMARASVMRLIARGELPARKDGGRYVLSPRDVRMFRVRLGAVRREALNNLAAMADEFGA